MIPADTKPSPILAADLEPGATCTRFGFSFSEGRGKKEHDKNRREFATYLLEWMPGVDVVEEWSDGSRRWVVLETPGPVSADAARSFAEDCPRYAPRSFGVDRTVR